MQKFGNYVCVFDDSDREVTIERIKAMFERVAIKPYAVIENKEQGIEAGYKTAFCWAHPPEAAEQVKGGVVVWQSS